MTVETKNVTKKMKIIVVENFVTAAYGNTYHKDFFIIEIFLCDNLCFTLFNKCIRFRIMLKG